MVSPDIKANNKITLLLVSAAFVAGCSPVSAPAAPAPLATMLPLTGTPALAPETSGVFTNPIYPGDFPDPYVLPVDDVYYAYSTNANGSNIPMLKLSAGFSQVEPLGDALPELPDWAAKKRSLTWAPSVLEKDGLYILFYTARYTQMGLQCISRAVSDRPTGPFVDETARPLICQIDLGGSIDPSPFVDIDGKSYLLWKNDGNSSGKSIGLWIQPLSEDGCSLAGKPRELIRMDQAWEKPVIEAPAMVYQDGQYYLFYSANWWESPDYSVGYAVCPGPTGPCVKPLNKPWFSKQGGALGPGGADFFRDAGGQLWMTYHAWTAPRVGYPWGRRSLRIEPVFFEGGAPVASGPTEGPQPLPVPLP
jgi:beta-xylosidase